MIIDPIPDNSKIEVLDIFNDHDLDRLFRKAIDYGSRQSWAIQMAWFGENKHLAIYWMGSHLQEGCEPVNDWWFMKKDGTWFSCEEYHAGKVEEDKCRS